MHFEKLPVVAGPSHARERAGKQAGGYAQPQHEAARLARREPGAPHPLPGWEQRPLGARRWAGGEGDPAISEPGARRPAGRMRTVCPGGGGSGDGCQGDGERADG